MLKIKRAAKEDIETLYHLIIGIAQHHDQEQYVLTNPEELRKAGFGENPRFGALIAEWDGEAVGYVSYTFNYSIWMGGVYLNIDDLFVWKKFRGKKIGEQLMLKIKEVGKEQGLSRIRWEVEQDNLGAIKFYEKLGAELTIKGIFRWNIN